MRRGKLFTLLLICIGIVLGAFLTRAASEVSFLRFFNWGVSFGFDDPVTLDLQVIQLTFAVRIHLTLGYLLCMLTVLWIALKK